MTHTPRAHVSECLPRPHRAFDHLVGLLSRRRTATTVELVVTYLVVCAFWGTLASIAIQTVLR